MTRIKLLPKFQSWPIAILLLLFVFTTISAHCQDVILKKSGDEIKAKVDEIGDSDIKYHKFDNLDGPAYSIKKSDVFMITFKNGSKEVFNNTEKKEEQAEQESSQAEDPDKLRMEAAASNVYSQIINCCSGKKENARFEIFYDAILKSKESGEIKIPIKVSWVGAFESNRWVRGTVILIDGKKLGWVYQSDSGGLGMGCAKKCKVM
jgi:hypothetical protein